MLEQKIDFLRKLGVKFVQNVKIGTDVTLEELHDRDGFDVVFVGTGAGTVHAVRAPLP